MQSAVACIENRTIVIWRARARKRGTARSLETSMPNVQSKSKPVNAPEDVRVIPSGAAVGAEIHGVDLSQPVPEASKEIMRQAWADHGVLLWRDQNLPDISFLEAAAIFGVTKEPAPRQNPVAGGYQNGGQHPAPPSPPRLVF